MRAIRKYLTVLIASSVAIVNLFAQQSPQYTQYMFNSLAINPAYAGADEHPSITLVTRAQWANIDNAPSTQSLAAHTLVAKRAGLGLLLVHDQIGVHKNTNATASYAYHLPAGKRGFISLGLQGGVTMFRSDYASLAGTTNDPLLTRNINATRINLGAGIYFRGQRLDAGVSLPGLMPYKLQINDTITGNFSNPNVMGYLRYRIPLGMSFSLQPSALLKYFKDVPVSVDANCMMVYKEVLSTGISYRNNESLDLVVRLQLTKRLDAGYSYDYPIGDGTFINSSSHELMLHYVFRKTTTGIVSPR